MASNKPLQLAVVSIIRYPGKHDSASQESLLSLFGPLLLLANDKCFIFFPPKIRGWARAGCAPHLDPLLDGRHFKIDISPYLSEKSSDFEEICTLQQQILNWMYVT